MSNTDPGATAKYTIEFATSSTGAIASGTGTITLDWDDDFGIPATIANEHVVITSSAITTPSGATTAAPDAAVNPTDVTVTFIGVENDEPRMVITIGDMDPDTTGSGGNGIGNSSNVVITVAQAAGITNPTEGQTASLSITTSGDTTAFSGDEAKFTTIPRVVELSSKDGGRGDEITATAKGFKNSTTATFWRDADGDGNRDAGELDLCSAEVASDDTASCAFTITVPPFEIGTFASGGDCDWTTTTDEATVDCNFVNAIDGRDQTKTVTQTSDITSSQFEVEGKVTAVPDSGSPGDNIVVQIEDYAASTSLTSLYLAGTQITTLSDGSTTIASKSTDSAGNLTITVTIPDGVAPGKQALKLVAGGQTQRDTVTIGGASVTATPSGSVKPNQRITLIGSGFTTGGSATISTITIGGATVASAKINDGSSVTIDNGGSWSSSVDLPVIPATTAGGDIELKVTDSGSREGTTTLTFPARSLTISPQEGRVGTQVSVVGANFPAKNDEGESVTVTVTYDAGTNKTNSTTVVPDASGNFTASVQVPTNASIPSDNTVKASFDDASSTAITVYTTDTHSVPSASIALSKDSGPAGTTVTITGTGFKRYSPVSEVLAGTTDVTPSPKPSTDANGAATFDITIPGLDVGAQTIKVEPLGDSLVRVFNFNNVTKTWSFYDPRPEFADANTISELTDGDIYWINVSAEQTDVTLNAKSRDLTCSEGDCWNQIVW